MDKKLQFCHFLIYFGHVGKMYFISQWSLCNILEEMQFSLWFRLFMDTQYTGYFILILIHYSQPSSHQRHQNGLFLNHIKNSKISGLPCTFQV